MNDPTEQARREMLAKQTADSRAELLKIYPQVWDTEEMRAEFEAIGFMAPIVTVRRRSDGKLGSLEFQAHPRFYHSFVIDS